MPDLHLRATSELAARGLPATLAPSVVAFALQDYLDEVQPSRRRRLAVRWRLRAREMTPIGSTTTLRH